MTWPLVDPTTLRSERHYGDRTFLCHAERPSSIHALFAAAASRTPDREAVVAGELRLTYAELDRRSESVAGNLSAYRIGTGDRIAILLSNRAEFVIYLLACARLGAIAVPMGTRLKAAEVGYALTDSGAAALVYETEYAGSIPAPETLPALRVRICVDGPDGADWLAPASLPPAGVREDDTAIILYTSGTTGRPKGAMLTHLGIIHSAINFALCLDLSERDRAVLTVPASHVTGLVAVLFAMLHAGGCTVMMRAFKATDFVDLAAAERLTYTIMVPAQYALCLMRAELQRYDLSSWRIGGFGGAPMPEATISALAEVLPNLTLVNAYGATETTSPTSIMPPGLNNEHADSVGRIVPCGEVRIVDEAGRDVPPGEPGEIWIKGPMVVPGYWNKPEATAREFTDGFWHSGDIGSFDAEGFLRVFDRKKDMINRAGYKVYSAEVENLLSLHPGVVESAVIGRPDPVLGERVHAVVRPRDATVTVEALKAFCAQRLADYKIPETIELVAEALPRNANGKVQKRQLRERINSGANTRA